jgi:hypothetical protein
MVPLSFIFLFFAVFAFALCCGHSDIVSFMFESWVIQVLCSQWIWFFFISIFKSLKNICQGNHLR